MHLAVLGAAGATGRHIVEQAASAGHQVTAVVRDPSTYDPPVVAHVVVRRGDVLEPSSMRGGLDGTDAVLFVVGPHDGRAPTRIYSQGMAVVTAEMRHADVTRLVTISAVPASLPTEKTAFERYVLHPILWRFFGPSYADLRLMEQALRATTDIDWTIIRPPRLTDDEATGRYRTAVDSHLTRPSRIARADLATAMLGAAVDDALIGCVVTVSA